MARCKECIHNECCSIFIPIRVALCDDDADKKCELFKFNAEVVPKSEEGAECPTCYGTGRIGTTNWLTKNISKKQLAEEKAKAIAKHEQHIKAEVAREIFEEIETALKLYKQYDLKSGTYFECYLEADIAELKKKYTGGET